MLYWPDSESLNQPNRRGTDPSARWCDRESPRGPTYVDLFSNFHPLLTSDLAHFNRSEVRRHPTIVDGILRGDRTAYDQSLFAVGAYALEMSIMLPQDWVAFRQLWYELSDSWLIRL